MSRAPANPELGRQEQSALQRNAKRIVMAGAQGALFSFVPGLSQWYAVYSSYRFMRSWFSSESPSQSIDLTAIIGFLFGLAVPEYLKDINTGFMIQASSRTGLAIAGASRSMLASFERAFLDAGVRLVATDKGFEAYRTGTGINALAHTAMSLGPSHSDHHVAGNKVEEHDAFHAKHNDTHDLHHEHDAFNVNHDDNVDVDHQHEIAEETAQAEADHHTEESSTGAEDTQVKFDSKPLDENPSYSQDNHAIEKSHETEQIDHPSNTVKHYVINDHHDVTNNESHTPLSNGQSAGDGCPIAEDAHHIAVDGCHIAKDGHHIEKDGRHIEVIPVQTLKQGIHAGRDKAYAPTNQYPDVDTNRLQSKGGPQEPNGVPPHFEEPRKELPQAKDRDGSHSRANTGSSGNALPCIDPRLLEGLSVHQVGSHNSNTNPSGQTSASQARPTAFNGYIVDEAKEQDEEEEGGKGGANEEKEEEANVDLRRSRQKIYKGRSRSKDKQLRDAIEAFEVDRNEAKLLNAFCRAIHTSGNPPPQENRVKRVRTQFGLYAIKKSDRGKLMTSFAQGISDRQIVLAYEEVCGE